MNYNIDNDPNDGDGCEFVAGILLDALPPFENQTAPPSFGPLLIGCLTVEVGANAPCDVDLPIEFCEGVNGNASVELGNIVVIDFESVQNFEKVGCSVRVAPEPMTLATLKDKGLQKQWLRREGLPTLPFRLTGGNAIS